MALNNFGLGFDLSAKNSASAAFINLGKNVGALQKSGEELNQTFDKTTGRTRDLTTGRFAAAPKGIMNPDFMNQVGGQLKGVSIAMLGLGASIIGGLGHASMVTMEFNKGMAELGTLVDHAAFPVSEMDKIVKDMMMTYGGDSKTQIAAMYQAISAGAGDAAKASSILTAANQLAIAGATDQKTALLGLTKVLNNYNMEFSESSKVADSFLTAIQGGSTTMSELGAYIGDVSAGAKAAGIDMNSLIGALGTGATLLKDTGSAATGLKAALAGLAHPTADAAAEAGRLGIKFSSKALRDTAGGFPAFLKSITSNSKYTADSMNKLFGSVEGANFMLALGANDGKAYADMMIAMGKNGGKASAAFEEMNMTMAQQVSVLKANFELFEIGIGQALAPVTGFLVGALKAAMVWFNNLGAPIKRVVAFLALAVGAISIFLGSSVGLAVGIAGLIAMGKVLLVTIAAVAAIFAVAALAIIPLIAAGAALYYSWTHNLGGLASNVKMWFAQISLAYNAVVQLLSTGELSGQVLTDLNDGNQGIKAFAVNVFLWVERIKNFFAGLGEGFEQGMKKVGPIIQEVVAGFQKLFDKISPVQEAADSAKKKFEAFGSAGNKTGNFLTTIIGGVATGLVKVLAFVDGLTDAWNGVSPAVSAVWGAVKALYGAFTEMMGAFGGPSVNASAETWKTVGTVIGWIANVMVQQLIMGMQILGGVFSVVGGVFGAIGTIISGVFSAIWTGIKLVWALMTGDFGGAFELAKDLVVNWANTVTTMIGKVVGGVAGMADSLAKIFGKDLGLKASVEGFVKGIQIEKVPAAGAAAPPGGVTAAPVGGQANPGVAAAQAARPIGPPTAAAAAALIPEVTVKSQLVIDSAVLAEATSKAKAGEDGRSYHPNAANV